MDRLFCGLNRACSVVGCADHETPRLLRDGYRAGSGAFGFFTQLPTAAVIKMETDCLAPTISAKASLAGFKPLSLDHHANKTAINSVAVTEAVLNHQPSKT
jgi:hypothetical protein